MTVASSDSKTFVTFSEDMTTDMSDIELPIVPIKDNVNVTQVGYFVPDKTFPQLTSYSLDMNSRQLELRFSEPVRASSLDPSEISLQNVADVFNALTNTADTPVSLATSTTSSPNGLNLTVGISDSDFNNLKLASRTALSASTTFLVHTTSAYTDMIVPPNSAKAIVDGVGMRSSTFNMDAASPNLDSYTINMNTGTLSLTFSEPADASTVDVTKIFLQNAEVRVACNEFGQCSDGSSVGTALYALTTESTSVVEYVGRANEASAFSKGRMNETTRSAATIFAHWSLVRSACLYRSCI